MPSELAITFAAPWLDQPLWTAFVIHDDGRALRTLGAGEGPDPLTAGRFAIAEATIKRSKRARR